MGGSRWALPNGREGRVTFPGWGPNAVGAGRPTPRLLVDGGEGRERAAVRCRGWQLRRRGRAEENAHLGVERLVGEAQVADLGRPPRRHLGAGALVGELDVAVEVELLARV